MPHNAVIRDEQTGEELLLWASLRERARFPNKITSEPVDIRREGEGGLLTSRVLAEHIKHLPMTFEMTVDLIGDPSRAAGSVGGEGYEVEQYAKLVEFSNRDTTFTIISYAFVNASAVSDTVVPGLVLPFMGMEDFDAVKDGKRQNIIGAKISFQSVVITYGGEQVEDPDEAYGIENSELSDDFQQEGANALLGAGVGATLGVAAALALAGTATVAVGAITAPIWAIALGIGAVVGAIAGVLGFRRGSVPHQLFRTEIFGIPFVFELRTNYQGNFCTFSAYYDGAWIVRETKIVYGMDLLSGVVHPMLSGLHIVPFDLGGEETDVTPDNLGLTVQLYVIVEIGA